MRASDTDLPVHYAKKLGQKFCHLQQSVKRTLAEIGSSAVQLYFCSHFTKATEANLRLIRETLQAAGIEFIGDAGDGPGVRLWSKSDLS